MCPSSSKWFEIKCLCSLLDPFEEATRLLGEDRFSTLPSVIRCLPGIKATLERLDNFVEEMDDAEKQWWINSSLARIDSLRETLLHLFKDRFTSISSTQLWVSFSDPWFTAMAHLQENEKRLAESHLLMALIELSAKEKEDERGRQLVEHCAVAVSPSGRHRQGKLSALILAIQLI